ncbi:hypothetical protein SAMN05216188_12249 [Lentzea xinjiangensis]|uniref:Uncharacterized protein n=1 Tax=Lentzea xinjiangensis TaxID=402600 RepID=A0A1H9UNY3_9PSEU|nr:hypothetical protein [Lentzea xinjiangensis]SES11166.1 hypothetical protein SAMN05216188_12249 [Lentzea xinjiangensis]
MATLDNRVQFTRPQFLTLTVGVVQLAFGWFDVFGLDPHYHVVQIGVGALGVLMAWRLDHARMYGLLLLICFGTVVCSLNDMTTEAFLGVRMAVMGLVITLTKPAKAVRR